MQANLVIDGLPSESQLVLRIQVFVNHEYSLIQRPSLARTSELGRVPASIRLSCLLERLFRFIIRTVPVCRTLRKIL
jgi:hypothetical protein